jgi:hypothetical protein
MAPNPAVVDVVNTNGALTVICPADFKFKSFALVILAAPTLVTVNVFTYNVAIVYVPLANALTTPVGPCGPTTPCGP